MRNKILLIIAAGLLSLPAFNQQKKKDILNEINGYYRTVVSNAIYKQPQAEVWEAMYAVVSENYPEITKESESKGWIEAKTETTTRRYSITAEIRGETTFRVIYTYKYEYRMYNNASYGPWLSMKIATADDKILYLQQKTWEKLNGPIELSADLQQKIQVYNSSQKKEKNKIIKGNDY